MIRVPGIKNFMAMGTYISLAAVLFLVTLGQDHLQADAVRYVMFRETFNSDSPYRSRALGMILQVPLRALPSEETHYRDSALE